MASGYRPLVAAAVFLIVATSISAGRATSHVTPTNESTVIPHGVSMSYPQRNEVANSTNLTITNFSVTPSTVTRVQETNLSVSAHGGVGPLTYVYENLPVGCTSVNWSLVPCYPAQVRDFVITVQVTDARGDLATATANLTVVSGAGLAPLVTAFTASPGAVQQYHATEITVTAISRSSTPTAFLTYQFFDLPAGCASFNQTQLTCLPTQAGMFHIQVEVADGFGSYVFASTNLTVTGTAAGPGTTNSTTYWVYGGLGAVALVAILGIVLWRRDRSRT